MGLFGRSRKKQPEETPAPSALVVPLLAGNAWLAANEEAFAGIPDFPDEAKPFAVALTPELWVTYAIDPSGSWEYVQRGQVDGYGGAEALHAAALHNLRARIGADVSVSGGDGRYRLETPGEYDLSCSLLLAPDLWTARTPVRGDAVLCAPTRVEVLVCGSEDQESVEALRAVSGDLYEEARGKPVTPALHLLAGGSLSVLR